MRAHCTYSNWNEALVSAGEVDLPRTANMQAFAESSTLQSALMHFCKFVSTNGGSPFSFTASKARRFFVFCGSPFEYCEA